MYNNLVRIEFDSDKRDKALAGSGLDFPPSPKIEKYQ